MNKLVEFFMWQYEGEYEQYFFTVPEEEDVFVRKALVYLNSEQCFKAYPWSEFLADFEKEKRVYVDSLNGPMHLRVTYFVDFEGYDTKRFNIDKVTNTLRTEKFI